MFGKKEKKEKNVILKPLGIMIAPEIFTVTERIYLTNGRAVVEGTQYFSWSTALALITEGHISQGWRLPTLSESETIKRYCDNNKFNLSALGLNGYIAPHDMIIYNYIPKDSANLILKKGKISYCWTSDLHDQNHPYVLEAFKGGIKSGGFVYSQYGLPMLLIKNL